MPAAQAGRPVVAVDSLSDRMGRATTPGRVEHLPREVLGMLRERKASAVRELTTVPAPPVVPVEEVDLAEVEAITVRAAHVMVAVVVARRTSTAFLVQLPPRVSAQAMVR